MHVLQEAGEGTLEGIAVLPTLVSEPCDVTDLGGDTLRVQSHFLELGGSPSDPHDLTCVQFVRDAKQPSIFGLRHIAITASPKEPVMRVWAHNVKTVSQIPRYPACRTVSASSMLDSVINGMLHGGRFSEDLILSLEEDVWKGADVRCNLYIRSRGESSPTVSAAIADGYTATAYQSSTTDDEDDSDDKAISADTPKQPWPDLARLGDPIYCMRENTHTSVDLGSLTQAETIIASYGINESWTADIVS